MSSPWRWARRAAAFAAVAYVGLQIRIPGIDASRLLDGFRKLVNRNPLVGVFDALSAGGLSRGTVLALGIAPYLVARTYMWGAKKLFPRLAAMDADDSGHERLKWYTRALTVVLALIQSIGYAQFMQSIPGAVVAPGPEFVATTMAFLTTASVVLMWLSERITANEKDDGIPHTAAATETSLPVAQAQAALNAPQSLDDVVLNRARDRVKVE